MSKYFNDLTRIRIYYLLWIGGGGFYFPFISLFYKDIGLTGTEIGMLASVGAIIGLTVAPMWGRRSDSAKNPRRILQLSLILSALCILWISQQTTFLWIAFIIALQSLVASSNEPISTTQTLAITDLYKSGFGSVRLFGSLGWAIAAPLAGWLIEATGVRVIFPTYAFALLLAALVLTFIVTSPPQKTRNGGPAPSIKKIVTALSHDRSMVGLAVALVLFYFVSITTSQFESLYLQQLGANESIIGVANSIGAIIELPAMLIADRLVKRFGSGKVIAASMLLRAVGMSIVVLAPSVNSILVMRTLQGFYYSMFAVSCYSYAADGAPDGQSNTILALYYVTLRGLTVLFSGPIGGAIFDTFGAHALYILGVFGSLSSGLILWITRRKATRTLTPAS